MSCDLVIPSVTSNQKLYRVVATIHNCDGILIAYSLSASAYAIKSHSRNIKPLQPLTHSRVHRRWANSALDATSFTTTTRDHALPSSSSATGSSGPHQSGETASTGGPPAAEQAVDRLGAMLMPIVGPQLQSLLHEQRLSSNPTEGSQLMPTLDEAVPPSCSYRGNIVVSLFVNNLPPHEPIYARFGETVVKTVCVQCSSLRFAYRSNSGSEDPPCVDMQGSAGARPM